MMREIPCRVGYLPAEGDLDVRILRDECDEALDARQAAVDAAEHATDNLVVLRLHAADDAAYPTLRQ